MPAVGTVGVVVGMAMRYRLAGLVVRNRVVGRTAVGVASVAGTVEVLLGLGLVAGPHRL